MSTAASKVRSAPMRPSLARVILTRLFSKEWGKIVVGLMGLGISMIFWIFGAKFSADGILVGLNLLLNFLGVPWGFVVPPHYAIYCLICPLPVAFSYTEWTKAPVYYDQDEQGWLLQPLGVIFVWLFIGGLDFATNFGGLGVDNPKAPLFWHQAVQSWPPRAIIAGVLTIAPEALARSMVRYIRSAW